MKRILLALAVLAAVASPAMAATFNPMNTRPVAVGTSGEMSLQAILDTIYGAGVVSAKDDQQAAGMWGILHAGNISPELEFKFAGNANSFGIWAGNDSQSLTTMKLFGGSTPLNTPVTVKWTGATTGYVYGPGIVQFDFYNIPWWAFGFYIEGPDTTRGTDGKFWSVDALNYAGAPQMLAYRDNRTSNLWTIAFEDRPIGVSSDNDHNDLVVTVESIVPVPEPGSMVLLGTGLFGLAGAIRRRIKR